MALPFQFMPKWVCFLLSIVAQPKWRLKDTMVTVVDSKNFFKQLKSTQTVFEARQTDDEEDERTLAHLLIEQMLSWDGTPWKLTNNREFADVILVNKIDLVSPEELEQVIGLLSKLNPSAKLIKTKYSKVPLKGLSATRRVFLCIRWWHLTRCAWTPRTNTVSEIINTNRFDFEKAALAPGWLKEMRGEHVPESEEYGINSFIYRARKPFHPKRLWDILEDSEQHLPTVIRSKGFAW